MGGTNEAEDYDDKKKQLEMAMKKKATRMKLAAIPI